MLFVHDIKNGIENEAQHKERQTKDNLLEQLLRCRRSCSLVDEQLPSEIADASAQRLEHAEDGIANGLVVLKILPHDCQTLQ